MIEVSNGHCSNQHIPSSLPPINRRVEKMWILFESQNRHNDFIEPEKTQENVVLPCLHWAFDLISDFNGKQQKRKKHSNNGISSIKPQPLKNSVSGNIKLKSLRYIAVIYYWTSTTAFVDDARLVLFHTSAEMEREGPII